MPDSSEPFPIRVFLSYARRDDEAFPFIESFRSSLAAMIELKSGRPAEIYLDKGDIGWGDNWRGSIEAGLLESLFFMPFISATYLGREHCRDEFTAFQQRAAELGLTGLILPVLPFRTAIISPDSEDAIVSFVEAHQYQIIEQAILNGLNSPEWNLAIADLATSLLAALPAAEEKVASLARSTADELARVEDAGATIGASEGGTTGAPRETIAEMDWFDLTAKSQELGSELNAETQEIIAAFTALEPVVTNLTPLTDITGDARRIQVELLKIADDISMPSQKIGTHGQKFNAVLQEYDLVIRRTLEVAQETGDPEFEAKSYRELEGIQTITGPMASFDKQLGDLLTAFRPLEAVSSPLRRALSPARSGLTAMRDGIRLMQSWSELLPDA